MDNIYTNSKNSKTSDPNRQLLSLQDKIDIKRSDKDLKRSDKHVAFTNLSIYYYTWKNIKKNSYKNNKFKISTPTWNNKFETPGGSYSVSDIQDYFEYIKKTRRKD